MLRCVQKIKKRKPVGQHGMTGGRSRLTMNNLGLARHGLWSFTGWPSTAQFSSLDPPLCKISSPLIILTPWFVALRFNVFKMHHFLKNFNPTSVLKTWDRWHSREFDYVPKLPHLMEYSYARHWSVGSLGGHYPETNPVCASSETTSGHYLFVVSSWLIWWAAQPFSDSASTSTSTHPTPAYLCT